MKIKTILTSIIALCMACPTYADIGKNESNPSCDQSTIGATTGTTDLEAEWDPNTINMEWYVDGSKITPNNPAANTCTYDGNVTLPTNTLSKTGYTFDGWRVVAGPSQCSLSGLDASIGTTYDADHMRWKPSTGSNGFKMQDEFGRENSDDLNNGEWAVTFSYGTIKGESLCSATIGNDAQLGNPNTTASGRFCWCKPTEYTPNGGNMCAVASPAWVFYGDTGNADNCADGCAYDCAYYVQDDSGLRGALFGSSN